jgi:hypothetical protein
VRSPVLEGLKVFVDHRQVGQLGLAPRRMRALLSEAWHDSGLPQKSVRTYIVRLRRKLAGLGAPVQVANMSRRGYSLVFVERPGEGLYDSAS